MPIDEVIKENSFDTENIQIFLKRMSTINIRKKSLECNVKEVSEKIQEIEDSEVGENKNLKSLLQIINENYEITQLKPNENMILIILLEYFIQVKENQRSIDKYAAIFMYYIKIFKASQHHAALFSKANCLHTREIAFAMHSTQKEYLLQECIEKPYIQDDESDFSWNHLKIFGIPLWFDKIEKFKYYIEIIAKNVYRKTRDPFEVCLWYILLGKKSLLANLFQRDKDLKKIYDFLQRDFNDPQY